MANPAFRLHGAGHGLADYLFAGLDFASPRFAPIRSRRPGDGGLAPGSLVFVEDLERFAGRSWEEILSDLAPGAEGAFHAGGPALVSLTLAAQLLRPSKIPVTYFGLSGDDAAASRIRWLLAQTPLDLGSFRQRQGRTDVTWVLSDPGAGGGDGERCFVHRPGSVSPDPDVLGESFFQATVNLYAGTALTPGLHRVLPDLLAKSRRRGAFTVVGTVFDFAAEREGRPWSLGGMGGGPRNDEAAWPLIDLLVGNETEILRLAGMAPGGRVEAAVDVLLDRGLTAAVATRGAAPTYYRSIGGLFGESRGEVPVDAALAARARDRGAHPGDTTGAGDNFLGGLLASCFQQWLADDLFPKGEVHIDRELHHMNPLKLRRAVEMGNAAGGLACLQPGGIRLEKTRGERMGHIRAALAQSGAAEGRWRSPSDSRSLAC